MCFSWVIPSHKAGKGTARKPGRKTLPITEGKELEGITPKLCVMMIGTNNTGGDSAEAIAGGIQEILRLLKTAKPEMKVLLLAVFPRANGVPKDVPAASKEQLSKKIDQINAIISKFDDGKTVFYKNINEKFLNKEGGLDKEVMPDYLHLSVKGYEIEAEAIKPEILKLLK
jgi:lysophospholipase L1-like esterase